ncbi:MAG: 4Fe-4S dicluster domain-containing protein [Candidatus Bathyarchaeota archaeon]|nr:MAG: 4Fe-4S dicluster domain-containing protein [Candidatus Bathyarchaeota archaeon]
MERTTNLSKVSRTFFEEVMKSHMGRTLSCCYQCGTCSSSCPVAEEMDIKPHEMVEMIKLGLKNTLVRCKALWQCSTCYMCTERCPQGVKLASLILGMRDVALREGIVVPRSVEESCKNLNDTGRLIAPSRFQMEKRLKLKLPSVPSIDTESIKGMVNKTRVADILKVR